MAVNGHTAEKVYLERDASLYLRSGTSKGRGVFAGRTITSGTIVETCPVIILDPIENVKHIEKTSLYHYTFNWPATDASGRTIKTQAIVFGLGSMFNHSRAHQNVGWKRDSDRDLIVYSALRDINEGEELCISYGDRLTFDDVDGGLENGAEESAEEHLGKIQLT